MKTLMINASPKKKMSASSYFLFLQKLFICGKVVTHTLRNKGDHKGLMEELSDTDSVIFCLPLYVDGVPAHVLCFMKELENYCAQNDLHPNVYVISNGGFIEGNQNRVLMQIFENFCNRSGLKWCGGIGIGGGVMLNVMRILFFVFLGLFLLELILGVPLNAALNSLAENLGVIVFFQIAAFIYFIGMGTAVSRRNYFGVKFTRVMMPSFLFILVADLFFVIISIFQGGIFQGWLKSKQSSDSCG